MREIPSTQDFSVETIMESVFLLTAIMTLIIYKNISFRKKVYNVLNETLHRDPWASGRYLISLLWDAHGYIWHGEFTVGREGRR